MTDYHIITAATFVVLPAEPPGVIDLMPLGHIRAADGREWWLRDADAVIAASMAGDGVASRLVTDFDHQTDSVKFTGGSAPAAGWITGLFVDDATLRARVEWTTRGAGAIAGQEYRFVSPTFEVARDGTVIRILRAALTNDPAITSNRALARQKGDIDVTTTELQTAIARATAAEGVASAAREALGLAGDAGADTIRQEAARLKGVETTLAGQVQQLSDQITAMRADRVAADRQALIDGATRDGKLAPSLVEWAQQQPIEALQAFIDKAPVLAKAAADDPGKGRRDAALSAQEEAVIATCALTRDQYIASRDALAQRGGVQ